MTPSYEHALLRVDATKSMLADLFARSLASGSVGGPAEKTMRALAVDLGDDREDLAVALTLYNADLAGCGVMPGEPPVDEGTAHREPGTRGAL